MVSNAANILAARAQGKRARLLMSLGHPRITRWVIEVMTCCCRALSAGCSSPFSSHPFVRKRPQRRGSDWSRLFIGRARGNSNTRSLVPSVAVSFRSNPRSASLGTGCWIGECPGTISDRSPCHRWSAPYVQSFDVVGSRSKRSNCASFSSAFADTHARSK